MASGSACRAGDELRGIVAPAHPRDDRLERGDVGGQHPLLDAEQLRRMHREVAQARGRAAAASGAARRPSRRRPRSAPCALSALAIAIAMSFSTAGCSGSYRCATASSVRSIASVYWIRSLVPIDRKSSFARNDEIASAAAGISIMPPTSTPRSNGTAALAQRLLRLRDHRERLVDLADRGEHRHQDLHLAVVRRAQDRAQLREEQPRLGEAEAHGAQAQRRIGRHARPARPGLPSACRRRGRTCGWSPACPSIPAATLR